MVEASALARLLRDCQPRVLAALLRRHRDLATCEDALQEALCVAAQTWPREGLPDRPHAWLLQLASRRCIDVFRADTARTEREQQFIDHDADVPWGEAALDAERDDSLDLFFLCCHPALSSASAIALSLRALGGLTTAQLAHAFLVSEATMGQRLSRARATLAATPALHEPLDDDARAHRLPRVLHVLSLIFNEGYVASEGETLMRVDLATEALRLARMVVQLAPTAEAMGLLALMLLTDARRDARTTLDGELITLDAQDRSRWNPRLIHEGRAWLEAALSQQHPGPWQVQAAIAALHSLAPTFDATDWPQLVGLYEHLATLHDGPMVQLNLAIARAQLEGPHAGLGHLAALDHDPRLREHHRLLAAKAHFHEKAGAPEVARDLFLRAAARTANAAERRALLRRARVE